MFIVKILMNLN